MINSLLYGFGQLHGKLQPATRQDTREHNMCTCTQHTQPTVWQVTYQSPVSVLSQYVSQDVQTPKIKINK